MDEGRRTIRRRSVVAGGLAAMLPVPAVWAGVDPAATRTPLPYSNDIRLPGQLYAVVARPPVLGWSCAGFDPSAARLMRGVVDVTAIAPWGPADLSRLGGVAVLARDTWSALKGREALIVDWQNDRAPVATHERIRGVVVPRTAELSMETPGVTVRAGARRCDVWACLERPLECEAMLSDRLGLPRGAIVLHPTRLGGRPGGGCNPCSVVEGVLLSRAIGGAPVSILWTREDDIPFRVRAATPLS